MPRPLAIPVLVALVAFHTPVLATAKIPERSMCTVPTALVGSPLGSPLPSCPENAPAGVGRAEGFLIRFRDASNTPMAYEVITLDLSRTGCRLYGDDRPGTTVDCAAKTIRGVTNAWGEVTFAPRIGGVENAALVRVFIEDMYFVDLPARSTDLDADGITGIADFARLAANLLSGAHDPSTDFDPCAGPAGTTTLADFAVFGRELLRSTAPAIACP